MKLYFLTVCLLLTCQTIRTPFRSALPTFPPLQPNNQLQFSVINGNKNSNNLYYSPQNQYGRLVQLPISIIGSQYSIFGIQNFYQLFGIKTQSDSIIQLRKLKRNADGTNNNLDNSLWGSAEIPLLRKCPALYFDAKQMPMPTKYSPRQISNSIGKISDPIQTSKNNITMAFTIWGQFVDHDISLTQVNHQDKMDIKIPKCDEFMDAQCIGDKRIPFERSLHKKNEFPRNQINSVTAWLDASQVYGSSKEVADRLRTFSLGMLKQGQDRMLPLIKNDFHNSRDAGDIRANENIMLTSYHTIFMREHNRLCEVILKKTPFLTDENLYHAAKNYLIGIFQKITFYDFLPLMIGKKFDELIGPYQGYNPHVDPDIETEFSTIAFRVGHSLLVNKYPLINRYGETEEILNLNQMFFRPTFLNNTSMENLIRGMSRTHMKQKNEEIIDEIRNLLISGPQNRKTNLDLYALNIQRAKDHGIDNYNKVRRSYGLRQVSQFSEISSNTKTVQKLQNVYGSPDHCDVWVCLLSEDNLQDGVVGQLGATIIAQTFRKLRDGDRFWYEYMFPESVQAEIDLTTLSDVIMRNTGLDSLQSDLFVHNGK